MIESRNLSKEFDGIPAVKGVSFTVEPGEILGFLGPNGAGKSTTMRMLTGFLRPSGGSARVGGLDVWRDPVRAKQLLGYLPESAPAYQEMTVLEFLEFIAECRGFRDQDSQVKVLTRALEMCHLEDVRHQPIETLSKGFKQRVGLAQAVLHDPPYLVMDEPTDGLDPNQKHEVRRLIRSMAENKAIILSTHILEEVDALCTRVIIIADGRLLVDESPDSLRARSSTGRLDVVFRDLTMSASEPVAHNR